MFQALSGLAPRESLFPRPSTHVSRFDFLFPLSSYLHTNLLRYQLLTGCQNITRKLKFLPLPSCLPSLHILNQCMATSTVCYIDNDETCVAVNLPFSISFALRLCLRCFYQKVMLLNIIQPSVLYLTFELVSCFDAPIVVPKEFTGFFNGF